MKTRFLLPVLLAGLLPGPLAGQDAESLSQACDAGVMQSCDALGLRYEAGLDVPQDLERALGLFQQACDGNLMLGCYHLAGMYRAGLGVRQDLGEAASLYGRACDSGMMEACSNLAMSYERGDGVPQDAATASSLYQRACDGGVTWTCGRSGIANEPVAGVAPAAGVRITASVVDAETRDPLSEAIVEMPAFGIRMITDESGRVELPVLPAGRHRLNAERVEYQVLHGELVVPGQREVLIPLERTLLGDLEAPGRVVGRVLEGGREYGISDVAITVLTPTRVTTLSDRQGRFSLTGIETGLVDVRFERLGYAARTTTVIVQPDATVEINASMSTEPIELEPIEVVVRSRILERNGFYRRVPVPGDRFTRADIEAINPSFTAELFRRVLQVRVANGVVLGRRRGGVACRLTFYLNGIRMETDFDFETIPPWWLEGMEIYQGLYTPIEYTGSRADGRETPCGVVLLWT